MKNINEHLSGFKIISEPFFTSDYKLTKNGRLFKIANIEKWRVKELKSHGSSKNGRPYFILKIKGCPKRGRVFPVDELLAKYFLPEPKQGQILIHLNNDYSDSRLENLKWGFPDEHVFLKCEWKWVEGFEGKYLIDTNGKLYSINGREKGFQAVLGSIDSNGYHVFSFRRKGQRKKDVRRHVLVATAWIPNPNDKPHVNHINGIKGDDRIENLEWVTAKGNIRHAVDIGLHDLKGSKHPAAKFKKEEILLARKLAAEGVKHQQIWERLNRKSTRRNLTDAINGATWSWLKPTLSDYIKKSINVKEQKNKSTTL